MSELVFWLYFLLCFPACLLLLFGTLQGLCLSWCAHPVLGFLFLALVVVLPVLGVPWVITLVVLVPLPVIGIFYWTREVNLAERIVELLGWRK